MPRRVAAGCRIALMIGLSACGPAMRGPTVAPSDIRTLELERQTHPNDNALLVRLGAAYYGAGRPTDAIAVLHVAVREKPTYAGFAFLGLAFEAENEPDSALSAYRQAGRLQLSRAERAQLENRMAAVTRQRLAAAAKDAVAREAELSSAAPTPNSIAVLPWSYLGQNAELRPLERGLTHLVVTDLSRVRTLVLLERERAQALSDELGLSAAARVEPGTGARAGRLLRAARVVTGTLRETAGSRSLRLDANAVTTTTGRVAASGSATDRLEALFTMEKQVVFALLKELRIGLSPAERRAISERPTADLQAFLAFSRGLEAEDRGDFARAATEFNAAALRDPNFRMATFRGQRAALIEAGAAQGPRGLEVLAAGGVVARARIPTATGRASALRNAIRIVAPSSGSRLALRSLLPLPLARPSLPEALRQDNPTEIGAVGRLLLVIPRP